MGLSSEDKGPMVLNLINRFTNYYSDMIEGKFVKESVVDCLGGSRINYIFHTIFVKSVKDIDPFQYLTD
jgi:dynamin 1-like protein